MKQKVLKLMCLLCVCMMGASAWGTEKTITLDYNSFGLTTSSYASKTATVDGFSFTVNQGFKGTGNTIQMNSTKGSGILYNTTAIPGLKSITVNVSSGSKTYTVTTGTIETPSANSQTGTATGTYSAQTGDKYFQLKVSGASYFSSIVIKYEIDESKTATSLSWSASSATAIIGNTFLPPTLSKSPNDLEGIVYSSSNTNVATIDSETGELTLKNIGTTTITASFEGNASYSDSEASYTLMVDAGTSEKVTFSEQGYANAEKVTSYVGETFSITFAKGSGSTDPAYYDSGTQLRLYANNTMTISSDLPIYRVVVEFAEKNAYTISTGTYDYDATPHIWTIPNSKSITCTRGGTGQLKLLSVTVYTYGYTRTTTAGNYGTICLPYAVTAAERSGATFYSIAGVIKSGDDIVGVSLAEEEGTLAAGKPYIFKATGTKLVAGYSGDAASVQAATGLVGNLSATPVDVPVNGKCGIVYGTKILLLAENATATVGQNRAYINLDGVAEAGAGVKGIRLYFDGTEEATGINDLTPSINEGNGAVYNVNGQLLNSLQRGINIVNGKKVIIK